MKGIYSTTGKISCGPQETFFLFDRRKIYSAYWLLFLLASSLFSVQTAIAQDPTLAGIEATVLNYNEGQSATQLTNSITVSDIDSPILAHATIQISNNYSSTEDQLQFTD